MRWEGVMVEEAGIKGKAQGRGSRTVRMGSGERGRGPGARAGNEEAGVGLRGRRGSGLGARASTAENYELIKVNLAREWHGMAKYPRLIRLQRGSSSGRTSGAIVIMSAINFGVLSRHHYSRSLSHYIVLRARAYKACK